MRTPPILRRLVAVIPTILMVLASLSLAPTASAASSDDSFSYEFEIHENKTVDLTMIQKGDDAGSKSKCNSDDIENIFDDDDVKINVKSGDGGDSCTAKITNIPIKSNILGTITHKDDSFIFEMDASSLQYYDQVTVKVTFPGSVSKVSGDGKKSGSTATWNNAQDETGTLTAKGADHGSPLFMIIIIVVVIAAIGGGAAAFIIIRQKRAKTGAPGYPQPGQQPYTPQPGYGQPAQVPAPGAAQPGYYTQPGVQQPYNPQQGGTSGYNPGGQY